MILEDIIGLFKNYVSQTRKPEEKLRKMMLNGMNSGHAKMADWGLSHLKTIAPEMIADLGCGGGRNAGELLKKYPDAKGTAMDYYELSARSRSTAPSREYFITRFPLAFNAFPAISHLLSQGIMY